jgi:hypothetical protein
VIVNIQTIKQTTWEIHLDLNSEDIDINAIPCSVGEMVSQKIHIGIWAGDIGDIDTITESFPGQHQLGTHCLSPGGLNNRIKTVRYIE